MLDFTGDADEKAAIQEMVRATAVRDLAVVLDEQMAATGGAELLTEVELPLIDVLAKMERTGIAVDVSGLDALEKDFAAKVAQAQEDAWDAIGGNQINLGSPKQLQEVLFGELSMPKTKKTKTGYTTDADALNDLFAKTEHPFLEALLRHRDSARLRVTVEGLQKSVADDGRVPRPTSRPSPRRVACRRPTPTCRTSRSAPRRDGASASCSSSATATRR